MEKKILKPGISGGVVRFPNNPKRILQDAGEVVQISPFWLRRLKGGDVVEIPEVELRQKQNQLEEQK